jgi:DNA-binding MarR family transcriptional regulator
MAEVPSASEVAHELRAAAGPLMGRLAAERRRPVAQASVLLRLEQDGARTNAQLAVAESVTPQSMQETMRSLVRAGLVARTADPQDGRQFLFSLTELGRVTHERETDEGQRWLIDSIDQRLNATERRAMLRAAALIRRLLADGSTTRFST